MYVSFVDQSTKIKAKISTIHGPVDCYIGLPARDVVVVPSETRTGMIGWH